MIEYLHQWNFILMDLDFIAFGKNFAMNDS